MTRIDVPAGQDPKAYLNTAFSADIVGAAQALYRACYANGSLTLREFEGARMRMAEINGCQLCRNWRSGGPEAAAMIAGSELAGRETVADRGPAPDEDYYAAVSRWRDHPGYSGSGSRSGTPSTCRWTRRGSRPTTTSGAGSTRSTPMPRSSTCPTASSPGSRAGCRTPSAWT